MSNQILFVDDDANILAAYRRKLRQYQIETAQEPEAALQLLKGDASYAVIVADMQMPRINGVAFLNQAKSLAPDATRIMLTGNADQQTAVDAVNRGAIFRFLTKPCPTEVFTATLDAALEQYRLVTAERDLLQKTLRGSIKVLIDLLAMLDPEAFGQALTLKARAGSLAKILNVPRAWEIEIASMLYPIGQITLPQELRQKVASRAALTTKEKQIVVEAQASSHDLLSHIPRLESIGKILRMIHSPLTPGGKPTNDEEPPQGSRILKALIDLAAHEASGSSVGDAITVMHKRASQYDPDVLKRLAEAVVDAPEANPQPTDIRSLEAGFILAQDVVTDTGILLIRKGATVSEAVKMAIRNYHSLGHLEGPVMAIHAGKYATRNQNADARKAS
ncbi:MAG: response regulator [Phycisphaerales bacterium]